MSKRAEEAAFKAYPFIALPQYDLRDENPTDGNKIHRRIFLEGYDQAEKDLALTREDVRKLCVLSVQVEIELGRDISDREHYSEVLNLFNKQRKK